MPEDIANPSDSLNEGIPKQIIEPPSSERTQNDPSNQESVNINISEDIYTFNGQFQTPEAIINIENAVNKAPMGFYRICMTDCCDDLPAEEQTTEECRLKIREIQLLRDHARKYREAAFKASNKGDFARSVRLYKWAIIHDEGAADFSATLHRLHKASGCVYADLSHSEEYLSIEASSGDQMTSRISQLARRLKASGGIYLCPGNGTSSRAAADLEVPPEKKSTLNRIELERYYAKKFRKDARTAEQDNDLQEAATLHEWAMICDFEACYQAAKLGEIHKNSCCLFAHL